MSSGEHGDVIEIIIRNYGRIVFKSRCSLSNKKTLRSNLILIERKYGINFMDLLKGKEEGWFE